MERATNIREFALVILAMPVMVASTPGVPLVMAMVTPVKTIQRRVSRVSAIRAGTLPPTVRHAMPPLGGWQ